MKIIIIIIKKKTQGDEPCMLKLAWLEDSSLE
jgi:hypothetical protein